MVTNFYIVIAYLDLMPILNNYKFFIMYVRT